MKRYGWILLAVCLTAVQVLVVVAATPPMNLGNHPFLLSAILVLFLGPGLAGVSMIFMVAR
jgi:hypothetical protein